MNLALRAVSVSVLALAALAASAQTPAISFTSFGTGSASFDSTRGYAFDVTNSTGLFVNALSVFDNGRDGLAQSHQVGVWDSNGVLLASLTVPSGTAAALDSAGFRYISLATPLLLPAGAGYTVGAQYLANGGDFQANFATNSATFASGLAYTGTRFVNTSSNSTPGVLTRPTSPQTAINGLFGGSMLVTAAPANPTPEPSALAALGLGAVGLLRRRRRA